MQVLTKTQAGRPYIHDTDANRITFLDNRFYQQGDEFYPSVTTVLDAFPKGAQFYKWLKDNGENADEIRDEAGRRGSVVHNLTERYDLGEVVACASADGNLQYRSTEWGMFERYVEFSERVDPEIDVVEATVVSPELGIAGTVDRIMSFGGFTYLVDIKTSNMVHESYWLQLAAYREMLRLKGTEVDAVAILWLNAKTRTSGKGDAIQGKGWQFIPKQDTDKDLDLFLCTQKLWLATNEDAKPRNISYQLAHKRGGAK
jgi:ATP-dependent exoDNAse (exonuclease V) beta subunit